MTKNKHSRSTTKRNTPKQETKSLESSTIYLALSLVILSLVLYAKTIGYGFVYDDSFAITENYVTQKGWQGLCTIWTEHYRFGFETAAAELYRPLPLSMFAIEWALAPNNPSIHHAINIFLYGLTAWYLFFLIKEVFQQSTLVSFLGSLLFIVHPLHTEVVANIKSRDEILAFLFLILALRFFWDYTKKQDLKPLILALVTYLMALFSKESAITFLAIFPITLYFFSKKSLKQITKLSYPFLAPVILFLVIRYNVIGAFGNNAPTDELHNLLVGANSISERLATAFLILGKYLGLLLFPHSLTSDAGLGTISLTNFGDWKVLFSLLIHAGLLIFAFLQTKKRHFLAFCMLLYGITLSLNTNILLVIGSSYGERFLFTPSLGYCLAIAFLLEKYLAPAPRLITSSLTDFLKLYQKPLIAGSLLVAIYSFKTLERNPAWESNLTLMETDVKANPNSIQLNYNYGVELLRATQSTVNPVEKSQKISLAKSALLKTLKNYPSHAEAYGQLGLAYYLEGNQQAAMDNYKLANQYKSNNPKVYNNMGMLYYLSKDLGGARLAYEKAIGLDPKMDEAHRNLAGILLVQKEYSKAIDSYKKALAFDPYNAEIHYFMGIAYQEQGDIANAQSLLEKAFSMDPTLRNN